MKHVLARSSVSRASSSHQRVPDSRPGLRQSRLCHEDGCGRCRAWGGNRLCTTRLVRSDGVAARAVENADGELATTEAGASEREVALLKRELELLRRELEEARTSKEADLNASLAQYKELEEALALALHELERSAGLRSMDADGVEVSQLMEVVGNQEATLKELTGDLKVAQAAHAEAQAVARAAESQVDRERCHARELEEKCGELASELTQLKEVAEEAKAELSSQLSAAQSQSAAAEQEVERIKQVLAQHERELGEVKTTETSLKLKYDHVCKELEESIHQQKVLQAQISASKDTTPEAADDSMEELSKRYSDVCSTVSKLEAAVGNLQAQLEKKTEESRRLEDLLKDAESSMKQQTLEASRLKQQAAQLQEKLEDKAECIGALNKEKRQMRSEQDKANKHISDLESEIKLRQGELGMKASEIDMLATELEAMKMAENKLKRDLAFVQAEVERLLLVEIQQKSEASELTAKVVSLRTSLLKQEQDAHAQLGKLKSQISELESTRATLEDAKNTASQETAEMERALQEMDAVNKNQQEHLEGLVSERDSLVKEIEHWQAQASGLSHDLQVAEETIAMKDRYVNNTESKLNDLQLKLAQNEKALQSVQVELRQVTVSEKKATENMASLQQELTKRQHSLQLALQEKEALESRMGELESELLEQGELLLNAEQAAAKWEDQAVAEEDAGRQKHASLTQLKDEAKEEVDVAANLLTRAEEIADVLEKELTATEGSGDEAMDHSVVDLQQRVLDLEETLAEQSIAFDDALDRADRLQTEVGRLEAELQHQRDVGASELNESNSRNGGAALPSLSDAPDVEFVEAVKKLQSEEHEKYSKLLCSLENAAEGGEQVEKIVDHTKEVEEENKKLRRALLKRRNLLSQSRRFIEKFLQQQGPVLPDVQAQAFLGSQQEPGL